MSGPAVAAAQGELLLVVEDEAELLTYLVEELEDLGYRVQSAKDGVQALALAQTECPDLVLTDIMMPRMGGADLFFACQRTPALAQVPFLFLTALSSAQMLRALPPGETPHILKKPIDYDDLARAIRWRLARAGSRSQA